MEIKNIIWDFDGTLYDSYKCMISSFIKMLDSIEIYYDKKDLENMLKKSVNKTLIYYSDKYNLKLDEISIIFRRIDRLNALSEIYMYKELNILLLDLKDRNVKNFIFTHRDKKSTINLLKRDNYENLFDDILCRDENIKRKPNPQGFKMLIEKNNLKLNETIVIGDRFIDIYAAKAVGVESILVDFDGKIIDKEINQQYVMVNSVDELRKELI